jgi:chemotaxis protein MotA
MKFIIGIIIVTSSVLGGFVLSHGHPMALWQPFELLIIGGSALGAFIISNPPHVIKACFASLRSIMSGSKYNKDYYLDLLGLMFQIFTKARKEGLMALEGDVDDPKESPIFQTYPKILEDHHAIDFITDYLRIMVGGNMNPFELESLMDIELDTHHHESGQVPTALTKVADALPGFGIVAAVLGIVITMASIGGPPEILGAHVGAALVGTFLGILLAYGFVGPMATHLEHCVSDEGNFFQCIKVCLMANLNGYAPQITVEFGRKSILSIERPGFFELEEYIKSKPK